MEKAKPVVVLMSTYTLAIVFLLAGFNKAGAPSAFREAILGFRVVNETTATVLSYYVPWLELLAGVALFPRVTRRGAVVVVISLLAVFTMVLASACLRGIDPTCGCFGDTGSSGCVIPIARNALLMSLAGIIVGGEALVAPAGDGTRGKRVSEERTGGNSLARSSFSTSTARVSKFWKSE